MFFVNSRPCTLPQVSKAFNEVYKSFNITQSPFIFADIKLDTNAYDVNVSPDKRTILLHDQHALLESLKNSLSELFEGHDQSVPQAQLLDRKLPVFKPPEIRHRESTGSNNAGPSPAQHGPDASATPQSDSEPPTSPVPPVLGGHPGFVKASLIERFAGRDTEERVEHRPPINRRQNGPTGKRPLALSVQEDPEDEGERSMLSIVPDPPGREASPLFEPDAQSDISAHKVSKPVEDFNARIASQLAKRDVNAGSSAQRQEESIPAIIQTPQKSLSQSSIQNAFDRIRPMRTPLQQATITVGDTTSVTTIGNDSRASKRARIHTPKFSLSGAPLDQGTKNSTLLKSFRGFTAPGTQLEEDMEGVESRDDDDEPDSSMPDAHSSRSPSPVKRAPLEKEGHVDGNMTSPEQPRSPRIAENEIQEEEVDEIEAEGPQEDDASDDEYLDESEKKVREEAKIARMIAEAEEAAARPSEMNLKRAQKVFQPSRKKYQTIGIIRDMRTSVSTIERQVQKLEDGLQEEEQQKNRRDGHNEDKALSTQAENPEERLSLTVTKADFHNMRIIGQFNLGFILAVRPPCADSPTSTQDLFIIDQHASDEKYNFERLSSTSVLVSQRLVHPLPLELTAVEEETIRNHEHALAANGFAVKLDSNSCDGSEEGGPRRKARLVALPMSEKVTFNPSDLEELLVLLSESSHHSPSSPPSKSVVLPPGQRNIPRPSKITKILASRACRSSIMIGKNLTHRQMEKVVRHMGEMDKPWSCPHGRPTMRHLFSLDNWEGWDEVDGLGGVGGGGRTDWRGWLEDRMEE
jgi:DNA mismatch repair protein PMS2